jgi:hypothetical protein
MKPWGRDWGPLEPSVGALDAERYDQGLDALQM